MDRQAWEDMSEVQREVERDLRRIELQLWENVMDKDAKNAAVETLLDAVRFHGQFLTLEDLVSVSMQFAVDKKQYELAIRLCGMAAECQERGV